MNKKYSQISTDILANNPYWDYKRDLYTLPDLTIGEFHYIETKGSVMIIPLLTLKSMIMVKQFRYLNQQNSLEFPGGGCKTIFSIDENAKRELIEETGYNTHNLIKIGSFNPFNGVTNEICNVYLAKDIIKQNSNPDQSEEFEILNIHFDTFEQLIRSGDIWDGMTLAVWSMFKNSVYFLEK